MQLLIFQAHVITRSPFLPIMPGYKEAEHLSLVIFASILVANGCVEDAIACAKSMKDPQFDKAECRPPKAFLSVWPYIQSIHRECMQKRQQSRAKGEDLTYHQIFGKIGEKAGI